MYKVVWINNISTVLTNLAIIREISICSLIVYPNGRHHKRHQLFNGNYLSTCDGFSIFSFTVITLSFFSV